MKKALHVLFCGLLAVMLPGEAIPRQVNGQPDIPTPKLVAALRLLNTAEYEYRSENHRFADRDAMLTFLRQKGDLGRASIDLENPKPYELTITTSSDGTHYQITLQLPSDMHFKSTWCRTAAFSDDRGVIFLGQAIGCDTATK